MNRYRAVFYIGKKTYSLLEFDTYLEIDGLCLNSKQLNYPLFSLSKSCREFYIVDTQLYFLHHLQNCLFCTNFVINWLFKIPKEETLDIDNQILFIQKMDFHTQDQCFKHWSLDSFVQLANCKREKI
jgi:hypothetical protein